MRGPIANRGGQCAGLWIGVCVLAITVGCQREEAADHSPPPPVVSEQPQVYVADWANHRLARFADLRGEGWMTYGESGPVQFRFPVGVCLDAAGRIYVSEQEPRLHRLDDPRGASWTTFSLEQEAGRPRNKHLGCWVCVDRSGRIYFSDGAQHRIVRIDDISGTNRTALGVAGGGPRQFRHPAGIWVDDQDHIYVADVDNFRIVRCDDMQGTNWMELGRYGSGEREFINPCGICVDHDGRIYIADQGNDRIVRLDDMRGTNWTAIGSFGVGDEQRKLYAPTGVSVDRAGRIYVTQCSSNHRVVRMDNMSGANWTVFGSGGIGAGQFASPMGIFVR
jgi:sugar lactone lactonase YvrE